MPNSTQITEPSISVKVLPDGSREICSRLVIPCERDISDCRQFELQTQSAIHAIGRKVMELGLQAFDTNGEPITLGSQSMTSKGQFHEVYRTLFGPVSLLRHVYQSSQGGKTFVPLESNARILCNTTPQLVKCVASRYTEVPAATAEKGFAEQLQLKIDTNLILDISRELGRVALAKQEYWSYRPNVAPDAVHSIGLGIDGALVPILHEKEWRQAMAGTITLYDSKGKALYTSYFGNAPQAGKARFAENLAREVALYKEWYPDAIWVGISDGAEDLRGLLTPHCQQLVLDFYHVSEYLADAADAMQEDDSSEARDAWLARELHRLKHEEGAAEKILAALENSLARCKRSNEKVRKLAAAVSYLRNNQDRMDYAACLEEGFPIGSGITEAACKTLVKGRFCGTGMRWHRDAIEHLFTLKALNVSTGRWEEFWLRIDRRGY
jgi:hypothetical protein